jgi:hypothetical protein
MCRDVSSAKKLSETAFRFLWPYKVLQHVVVAA